MSYEIGPVDGWSLANIGPLVVEPDGTQSRTLTVVRGTPSDLRHIAKVLCENAAGEPGSGLGGYITGGIPATYDRVVRSTPDHPILKGFELVSNDSQGSGATAEGNVFLRYWFSGGGVPGELTWTSDPVTGATTFSGLSPGSTLTRTDPVYGPVPIAVDDDGIAVDTWPPLNSDVEYVVTDPDGTVTTIVVDTTVDGPDGPGSDPLPRLSVPSQPALVLPPVVLIDYTGAYPARNTTHDILDRVDPVVVQREPGLRRGELTYVFDDHGDAMGIADLYRTGAKIALRQATHDRLDVVHIATGDVQITPEHGGLAWRLRVAYTEVAP